MGLAPEGEADSMVPSWQIQGESGFIRSCTSILGTYTGGAEAPLPGGWRRRQLSQIT